MPSCDIVVVGGSAGAIESLQHLVRGLPADLPAAVFVVLHISAEAPSVLPEILSRAGPLPAHHAQDGEPVRPGQICIAPPDRHLIIEDGHVRVTRGPRENRHRPAIDPLFRSAARVYDSRVIGVVLSGHLDDGSAGLRTVRDLGGIAIVQDPKDAGAPQMPHSALEYAGADYILPKDKIGGQISDLVNNNCGRKAVPKKKTNGKGAKRSTKLTSDVPHNGNEPEANLNASRPDDGEGKPSAFACPECSGVLWELKEGELVRFRCRVGHSFTMASLAEEQVRAAEDALWAAMRALEEKASLATRISQSTSDRRTYERLREQAEADRDYAETIRKMLFTNDQEAQRVSEHEAPSADESH